MTPTYFGHDASCMRSPAGICKTALASRVLPDGDFSNFESGNIVIISLAPGEQRALLTAVKSLRFENLKFLISLSRSALNAGHSFTLQELVDEGACLDSIIAKLGGCV